MKFFIDFDDVIFNTKRLSSDLKNLFFSVVFPMRLLKNIIIMKIKVMILGHKLKKFKLNLEKICLSLKIMSVVY